MQDRAGYMNSSSVLSARTISKEFNAHYAVSGMDLDIIPGRVLGLLGPNGAGKSTTLRMMCGLIAPTSGTVMFKGKPLDKWGSSLYSHLSCVLEDSSLTYMFLSGWDNLYYQGALYGFSHKEVKGRSASLMDSLKLTEHMDKPVGDWSRGTQQKLALVTAMIPQPEVLILDEPTLGLDVVAKRDFLSAVKQLAQYNVGIIIASHQSEVIEDLADDIVLISQGTVKWSGSYQEFIRAHSPSGVYGSSGGAGGRTLEQILLDIFDNDGNSNSDREGEDGK